jgi:SAM-dependent methyltransferase
MMRRVSSPLLLLIALALLAAPSGAQRTAPPLRSPDVIFVPTPPNVVEAMLKLAEVHSGDVLYDLGCGDGQIVIAAARKYGIRAVGIDIDPQRIAEARANAAKAGVASLATFRNEDMFEADIKEATVVTLYLLTTLNVKLRPKLWSELKPGTRVVSQTFGMEDWEPEKHDQADFHSIFLWRIPEKSPQKK